MVEWYSVARWFSLLVYWKITGSQPWEFSETASADLKENLLPDVDEEIIEANFHAVCYWAGGAAACSIC